MGYEELINIVKRKVYENLSKEKREFPALSKMEMKYSCTLENQLIFWVTVYSVYPNLLNGIGYSIDIMFKTLEGFGFTSISFGERIGEDDYLYKFAISIEKANKIQL